MPGIHQSTRRLQIESPRKAYESADYNLGSISTILDGSGNLLSEQRYLPFGEIRQEIGTISQTDFSFTGQRSISMLSIMDYIARNYDPAIGRFIQPDTIIPNPANPQSWNRYSYTLNNPIKFSDPSGHSRIEEECGMNGEDCGERVPAYTWNSPENNRDDENGISTSKKGRSRTETVTDKALKGDFNAILDLVIPSNFGWRVQAEGAFAPFGVVWTPSGTLGVNLVYNRKSDEMAASVDWSLLPVDFGLGSPIGASVTTGPIIGWGSSDIRDATSGYSLIVSASAAAETAGSASISIPLEGNPFSNFNETKIHIDPLYGQIPSTTYFGVGIGAAYAGIGGGISGTVYHQDLTYLLPWQ